jgi:hypothetical protein
MAAAASPNEMSSEMFMKILRFDSMCHWQCFLYWWEKAYPTESTVFHQQRIINSRTRMMEFHIAVKQGQIPVNRILEYLRHESHNWDIDYARDSHTGVGKYVRMRDD